MKEAIYKVDPKTEFPTSERCHIIESSNSSNDPGLSIARTRVEAGVTTQWHSLRDTSERYIIISGKGRMEVGNLVQDVVPGDVVIIPANIRQRIANTGDEDLIFFALCTPRFKPEVYVNLEGK